MLITRNLRRRNQQSKANIGINKNKKYYFWINKG